MNKLPEPLTAEDELSLTELVNRVLDKGALISGEVVISVAGIDLVYLGLQLVVSSVENMQRRTESATE
jgi:gas vesicle structural protein